MRDDDSSSGTLFLFISIPVRQIILTLSGLKQTPSFIYSWFCNLAGLSRDGLSLYHVASARTLTWLARWHWLLLVGSSAGAVGWGPQFSSIWAPSYGWLGFPLTWQLGSKSEEVLLPGFSGLGLEVLSRALLHFLGRIVLDPAQIQGGGT